MSWVRWRSRLVGCVFWDISGQAMLWLERPVETLPAGIAWEGRRVHLPWLLTFLNMEVESW